jgi:hypothetical protein
VTGGERRGGASYHLAQINVARARAPLDHPSMAEFVANLDRINALAEASPGFVWRLQTEAGHATDIRAYSDPRMIVNMSVWETPAALAEFTYRSGHKGFFARRDEWFERLEGPHLALWWVPAGMTPSVEEGVERLDHLAGHGPTPRAFTFARRFPPPTDEANLAASPASA